MYFFQKILKNNLSKTGPKFTKLENLTSNMENTVSFLNAEIENFRNMRTNFERDLHSSQVKNIFVVALRPII
jgi:hypothetical protein